MKCLPVIRELRCRQTWSDFWNALHQSCQFNICPRFCIEQVVAALRCRVCRVFQPRRSLEDSSSDSESGHGAARSLSFKSESCNSSERVGAWDVVFEDFRADPDHLWHLQDRLGHLCFQYFDRALPYGRVLLMEKVNQLAHGFPELVFLRSFDLSPASWMSVAWYPIYHIPMGRIVRDLSACFLTYHTSSLSFQENEIGQGDTGSRSETEFSEKKSEDSQCISLPPFGLATYKMQGSLWTSTGSANQQRIFAPLTSVDSWLKQLRVKHPDFEYNHSMCITNAILISYDISIAFVIPDHKPSNGRF